jgi:hypothetical protein
MLRVLNFDLTTSNHGKSTLRLLGGKSVSLEQGTVDSGDRESAAKYRPAP